MHASALVVLLCMVLSDCDHQWRHGQAPPGGQATCGVRLSTLPRALQVLTGCQATMMREMASTLLVSLKEDTPADE